MSGRLSKLLTMVVGAFLVLLPAHTSFARTIKIATIDYQPFSSPQLRDGGFQTALIRAAFEAAGHNVEFTFYPWKRAYAMTVDGSADIVTSIFYTEERNALLAFSDPLYHGEVGLVGLRSKGISTYTQLSDLADCTIGVLAGAVFEENFDNATYLNKVAVSSDDLNMEMLFNGRVDLVATSLISFQHRVAASQQYDVNDLLIVQPSLTKRPVHVAASRNIPDHGQLIDDFNRGLAIIRANGTYNDIVESFGLVHLKNQPAPLKKSAEAVPQ